MESMLEEVSSSSSQNKDIKHNAVRVGTFHHKYVSGKRIPYTYALYYLQYWTRK